MSNRKAKSIDSEIPYASLFKQRLSQWKDILKDNKLKERDYHKFLFENAGITLGECRSLIVLSQIKLGSKYMIDFSIIKEGFSFGPIYEIVELKTPHKAPFTKTGHPSFDLIKAIQEIRNVRNWIKNNKEAAKELFPAIGMRLTDRFKEPNFKFKIIIGNRENSKQWLEERNQLSDELNIEIRSFDHIFDYIHGANVFYPSHPNEQSNFDPQIKRHLLNPFYEAWTDRTWSRIRKELSVTHFYDTNHLLIYRNRNFKQVKKSLRTTLNDLLKQLKQFIEIEQEINNQWLYGKNLEVYVRKGTHLINGRLIKTFDVANINPRETGRGYFTAFLTELEKVSPYPMYIENVLTPRFQEYFVKRGYHMLPISIPELDETRSFILYNNSL